MISETVNHKSKHKSCRTILQVIIEPFFSSNQKRFVKRIVNMKLPHINCKSNPPLLEWKAQTRPAWNKNTSLNYLGVIFIADGFLLDGSLRFDENEYHNSSVLHIVTHNMRCCTVTSFCGEYTIELVSHLRFAVHIYMSVEYITYSRLVLWGENKQFWSAKICSCLWHW